VRLNISNINTSRTCISNISNRHLLKSITICIDNITNLLFHPNAIQYRRTLYLNNSIHRITTCWSSQVLLRPIFWDCSTSWANFSNTKCVLLLHLINNPKDSSSREETTIYSRGSWMRESD
jgi:hypothetical protein